MHVCCPSYSWQHWPPYHCRHCCQCHVCRPVVVCPPPAYVPYIPPVVHDGYFEAQQKLAGKRSR